MFTSTQGQLQTVLNELTADETLTSKILLWTLYVKYHVPWPRHPHVHLYAL